MNRHQYRVAVLFILSIATVLTPACNRKVQPPLTPAQFSAMGWQSFERTAQRSTVNFAMWAGDESRNRYFHTVVAEELKQRFGIMLQIVPLGDTGEAVNKLLIEKSGGKIAGGSIDMLWINGENFRTAKQGNLLWGPFAAGLPSIRYFSGQSRHRDFGTEIEDMEAPWMRAQFVIAYDSARVPDPPRSLSALLEWVRHHPGRFTYPAPPDFTGSVFIRHFLIECGGGAAALATKFDPQLYERASACAFERLNQMRPYLWRRGETYPASPSDLNRLFSNGEIDFSMDYGPSFASQHIARGDFPASVRTYVFDEGTIGNHSYLAIPFNASNVAGAMVVINYLMSPEQELDQMQALGDIPPLVPERLSAEQSALANGVKLGPATLPMEELQSHLLPEPDAEYTQRFQQDWLRKVLQQR
jgi:putative spermidine/putrescine transport system substrate-binding protein